MRNLGIGTALVAASLLAACAAVERARPVGTVPAPVVEVAPSSEPASSAATPWWLDLPAEEAPQPPVVPHAATPPAEEEPAPFVPSADDTTRSIRGRVEFADVVPEGPLEISGTRSDGARVRAPVFGDLSFEIADVPSGCSVTLYVYGKGVPYRNMTRWPSVTATSGDQDVVLRMPGPPSVRVRVSASPRLRGDGWTFLVTLDRREVRSGEFITMQSQIAAPGETLRIPWDRTATIDRIRASQAERGVWGELLDVPADGREVVLDVSAHGDIFGHVRARDGRALGRLLVFAVAAGRPVRRSPVGEGGAFHVVGLEDDSWRLVVVDHSAPADITAEETLKLPALTTADAKWGDEDVTIELP